MQPGTPRESPEKGKTLTIPRKGGIGRAQNLFQILLTPKNG